MDDCGLTLLLVGDTLMTSLVQQVALHPLKKGCSMLIQCPLRLQFLGMMVC